MLVSDLLSECYKMNSNVVIASKTLLSVFLVADRECIGVCLTLVAICAAAASSQSKFSHCETTRFIEHFVAVFILSIFLDVPHLISVSESQFK